MDEKDRAILSLVREGLLLILDALERKLELPERTSQLRKRVRELSRQGLVTRQEV